MMKKEIAALVRKYLDNERIDDTYFVVNDDDVLTSEDWIRVIVHPSWLPKRLSPMYGLLTDITMEIREKEGVQLFLVSGDPLVEDEESVAAERERGQGGGDMNDEEALRQWTGAFVDSLEGAERKSLVGHFEASAATVEDDALRAALDEVIRELKDGNSMSRAFALRPDVFPPHFVTIVRYGEIYAEVDVTLRRYAERPEDLLPKCAVNAPVRP